MITKAETVKRGKELKELRAKICQYCIDNCFNTYETDIVLPVETSDPGKYIFGLTTIRERDAAEKEDRKPLHVPIETIESFEKHPYRWQMIETINRNYTLEQWQNWQRLQDLLGVEMSAATASQICDMIKSDDGIEVRYVISETRDEREHHGEAEKFLNDVLSDITRKNVVVMLKNIGVDIYKLIADRNKTNA